MHYQKHSVRFRPLLVDQKNGTTEEKLLYALLRYTAIDIVSLADECDLHSKQRLRTTRRIIEKLRRKGIKIQDFTWRDVTYYYLHGEDYGKFFVESVQRKMRQIEYAINDIKKIDMRFGIERAITKGH